MRSDFDPFLTSVTMVERPVGVMLQAAFDPGAFDAARLSFDLPPALSSAILKRRAEYAAGRLLARLCQEELGLAPSDVPIGPDRGPIWPQGLTGSITHSHQVAACCLVPDTDFAVGIDIEPIAEGDSLTAIRETVLSEYESALCGDDPCRATAVFSAKESLYKALRPRVGRFFGFDAAVLNSVSDDRVQLRLANALGTGMPEGQLYDIAVEHGSFGVRTSIAINVALHQPVKPG